MRAWRALTVAALIAASFWGGSAWQGFRDRALAEEHARWIARYRGDGRSLDEAIANIANAEHMRLLRDEWSPGAGEEFARGPVVQGRTIWIRRDQSIHWETAR